MKRIIERAHAFTDENSQAAWKMYQPEIWFSHGIINTVDSAEQYRQNQIPSATKRHTVRLSHPSLNRHNPMGAKLCSRGSRFTRARQSCHCSTGGDSPGVSHLLAVRLFVLLHRERRDKCFENVWLENVQGWSVSSPPFVFHTSSRPANIETVWLEHAQRCIICITPKIIKRGPFSKLFHRPVRSQGHIESETQSNIHFWQFINILIKHENNFPFLFRQ